nr:unnamed protein product [Spirometra erinaceieuropaei]
MSLRLPLREFNFAIIFTAYAPPMTYSDEAKTKLYEDGYALLTSVPKEDRMVVLGDLNTPVRTDRVDWFDENGAAISNLFAKRKRLRRAYLDCPIDANKATSYQCRRLVQKQLRGNAGHLDGSQGRENSGVW